MIGIFILAYRVGHRVYDVVSQLPQDIIDSVDEIIVIDNASPDDTTAWAEKAVALRGGKFTLIRNPRNLGYGGSHKVAFDYFQKKGLRYAVLFHGDGQGDIDALRSLINEAKKNEWDFVIGSRFKDPARLSKGYSFARKLGNYFFVWLQKWISGLPISDPGSGEVAYSLEFLKKIPYHRLTDTFHFTPQLLLYSSKFPLRILEIPISWGEVETSSANIFHHAWNMLKMLLAFRLQGIQLAPETKPFELTQANR